MTADDSVPPRLRSRHLCYDAVLDNLEVDMATLLVHVTCGPDDPTRAALAFLVARTALEDGHEVVCFVAGDAVQLMRAPTLDAVVGVGTGRLREHVDALVVGGARFYLSGMSSKARGLDASELTHVPCEMAPPNVLVRLTVECDRVLTY